MFFNFISNFLFITQKVTEIKMKRICVGEYVLESMCWRVCVGQFSWYFATQPIITAASVSDVCVGVVDKGVNRCCLAIRSKVRYFSALLPI